MPFLFRRFLEIIAGLLFFSWAWRLIYPIEIFEFKVVEQFGLSWILTAILSRIVIAAMLFIGLWSILGKQKEGVFSKVIWLLLLIGSSFDIIWKLAADGIIRFCYGCSFNSDIWLSIFLLVFLWVVFILKMQPSLVKSRKWRSILLPLTFPLFVLTVFILNPIFSADILYNQGDVLLKSHKSIPNKTKLDLQNTLLCCFSVSCPHCKHAAQKLKVSKSKNPEYPKIHVVYLGDEERVKEFQNATNTYFDYEILDDDSFFNVSGNRLPSIIYYKNDSALNFWSGRQINYGVMDRLNNTLD